MTRGTRTPADPSSHRGSSKRSMPTVAIESISGRERLERQRLRPRRAMRTAAVMAIRLIPLAVLILLGIYVLTLW